MSDATSRKALITGIGGFVGPYLQKELESNGYEVYGFDLFERGCRILKCDITDADCVFNVIDKIKPDFIFHLAGFSSVGKSFEKPELCHKINVGGTKNLLDAVIKSKLKPRILIVSSAEAYGKPEHLPIDEKHPLNPISPYGKSRVEQEKIALESGLPVIISRSFNHTGFGQPNTFVIPSFKKQVEDAEDGGIIFVGNLDVERDFSDVKDVVKAYRLLLEKGELGEIYNVGSGYLYKLKDILAKFIEQSGKELKVEIDSKRYRKADIPIMQADVTKLKNLIDFSFTKLF